MIKAAHTFLICLLLAAALPATAQTNAPARRPTQRYLFVLETSQSMQRRLDNAVQVALEVVRTGLNNETRAGDTIGVWTYNQGLSAGRFPLAQWAPDRGAKIAAQMGTFFRQQKFERKSDFRPVLLALGNLATNSDHLTIILISTGEEKLSGLSFEKQLSANYEQWRNEQQRQRMPFITIIRARRGEFNGFAVTPVPWQLDVPPWPIEPQIAKASTNSPLAPAPASAKPSLLPSTNVPGALIFTGKKKTSQPDDDTNLTATVSTTNRNSNSAPAQAASFTASSAPQIAEPSATNFAAKATEGPQNDVGNATPKTSFAPPVANPQTSSATDAAARPSLSVPPVEPKSASELKTSEPGPAVADPQSTASQSKPSVQTALVTPPKGNLTLWCSIGAGLLLSVCLFVFARREHTAPNQSLITKSLHQRQP